MGIQKPKRLFSADIFFFPLAAFFAATIIPAWLMVLQGWISLPNHHWHGHEMLFGYGLAVVCGYLVNRVSLLSLSILLLSWISARLGASNLLNIGVLSILPSLIFVGFAVYLIAPPFMKAAKKPENKVFAPLFIAMGICEFIYQLGEINVLPSDISPFILLITVDLFSLLLFLMGGRILAPAIAGHFYRKGYFLEARVQPKIERTAIVIIITMVFFDFIPKAEIISGLLAFGAAIAIMIRIFRWKVWGIVDEPYLWIPVLGYIWLALGFCLKGWIQMTTNPFPIIDGIHGVTIGALGTLTLAIMVRTRLQRSKQRLEDFKDIKQAALLISLAALLRLAIPLVPSYTMVLLWFSALAWCIAFIFLFCKLIQISYKDLNPS
ncbi:NnrS family protein [Candidatus Nitrosacidococcus tergens]|uniref:NnrS protein n=1 Tax=Candidatus Nitrosacidococcus tergens TaxID=553981 RepID=A0A7G1Q854_9GAMM|nr:NnrS family protein [Candidatus Nitrosacidococcus tergens]CAB1274988.1 NnrS protein [Candidatus Nitrosacidococcus tergens]